MAAHQELTGQFGRYRILRKLGAGGMGAVYLAEDSVLGRQVALKVPHFDADTQPTVIERFQREARLAASIDHPNLCGVFDIGEIEGVHYFTMPFIEGKTLSRLIEERILWDPVEAAELVRKLALAVGKLHQKGIVHRDLKPSNVLVRDSGEPVLMDFGLARSFTSDSQLLTRLGTALGSPAYMAPEQVAGSRDVGPATDIHGLGLILFELLTGQRPFEGPLASLYAQILKGPVPAPSSRRPGLDPHLDAICLKALARRPEDRFANTDALECSLGDFVKQAMFPVAQVVTVEARQWEAPAPQDATEPFPPTVAPVQPDLNGLTHLSCPNCKARMRVSPEVAGRKVRCPRCRTSLGTAPGSVAPAGAEAESPEKSPAEQATPSPGSQDVPAGTRGGRWRVPLLLAVAGLVIGGTVLLSRGGVPRPPTPGGPFPPAHSTTHILDLDGVKMEFVLVGKGRFWMGSPADEKGRDLDEEQKEVTIGHDFYIGKYEVTQEQWEAFMGKGSNPSYFSRSGEGKDRVKDISDEELRQFPVENVSWDEVQTFLKKLNEREKDRNSGWFYRLPREAEWEYSCRGGPVSSEEGRKTAPFYFGRPTFSLSSDQFNFDGNYPYGDAPKGIYLKRPCKVGSYKPNALGIYDLHGNVWEWCDDLYQAGPDRVRRGGSWDYDGLNCRAANRFWLSPGNRIISLGFRLVRVPSASK